MTDLVSQLVGALEMADEAFELEGLHKDGSTRSQIRAALSAAKDGWWQDISKAPRDPVCQDGNNHYSEYILAWWPGAIAPTRCRWWFRDDSDACNFIADGGYAVFPTVFQPLPNPPKGEEG